MSLDTVTYQVTSQTGDGLRVEVEPGEWTKFLSLAERSGSFVFKDKGRKPGNFYNKGDGLYRKVDDDRTFQRRVGS